MHKNMTITALLICSALAGCTSRGGAARHETAWNMAIQAHFTEEKLTAPPFLLTSYHKITDPDQPARIYIEGDGLAWTGRRTPSLDPTPINPVALKLATTDPGANVIYLARPCQYSKLSAQETACPVKYWTSHRFAPDVIGSSSQAIDTLKQKYQLGDLELIGFSGGGAVAALIAARRDDIVTLRTVAGNINHAMVMKNHNVSPLSGSLDAVDIAPQIALLPQHHFIGARDSIITPPIIESFTRAAGEPHCIKTTIVPEAAHEKGWPNIWPALLSVPLGCSR